MQPNIHTLVKLTKRYKIYKLLEKQAPADWLICPGREKIEEVCKGMFSILCMHFFIA